MVAAPLLSDDAALRRLERAENFPVALRPLPNRLRADLRAVYDVARVIDDVGDDPRVEDRQRLRLLDLIDADLHSAFSGGTASLDAVRGLLPAIRGGRLTLQPFLDLVEANRIDQQVSRYPSYDDLLHYCSLSANPVGRIVLDVFGVTGDEPRAMSDLVCTALQILEHCQDVGEDKRLRDRVYLPVDDLGRFGVKEQELSATATSPPLRRLVAFQVDRAESVLDQGAALVRLLRGWARVAVGGYIAGGRATVAALRRADHAVLEETRTPRRADVVSELARLLVVRR